MSRLTRLTVVLGLSALASLTQPVRAQTASPKFAEAIAESRARILDTMAKLRVPGAQIAVIKDGELVWSEGFGLADIEQQVPVTPITRFRIASISKPVTAVGLGLLIQEGKVDLDQPIQRYVPYFPAKRWPITVRQVAGHLAGIRHYRGDEFGSMKSYPTVREGISIFADDSLLFEPGTSFEYSSYGWNLISAVIEGASGEPFLGFMQRRVFGPMGMTRTIPEYPDSIIPWRAHPYVHADSLSPAQNAPYVDNSYKWAGGGFLSTSEDLARLGRNLLAGRLLKPETIELLWKPQSLKNGETTDYGIGWGTDQRRRGPPHRRPHWRRDGWNVVPDYLPGGAPGARADREQRRDLYSYPAHDRIAVSPVARCVSSVMWLLSRVLFSVHGRLHSPAPRPHLMGMPLPLPHYTIQDLESFPTDGQRYELLQGMLLRDSPGRSSPSDCGGAVDRNPDGLPGSKSSHCRTWGSAAGA